MLIVSKLWQLFATSLHRVDFLQLPLITFFLSIPTFWDPSLMFLTCVGGAFDCPCYLPWILMILTIFQFRYICFLEFMLCCCFKLWLCFPIMASKVFQSFLPMFLVSIIFLLASSSLRVVFLPQNVPQITLRPCREIFSVSFFRRFICFFYIYILVTGLFSNAANAIIQGGKL